MSAIKGRPATRKPAALSSVESLKAWSPAGWDATAYAVDIRVRVEAGSPAEAASHVQSILLNEPEKRS